MNRNIWVAEGFEEISIRHSKFAAHRLAHEAAPALERFAGSSPAPFVAGIKAARETSVARRGDHRESFLRERGFSKPETEKIIAAVPLHHRHPTCHRADRVQADQAGGFRAGADILRRELQTEAGAQDAVAELAQIIFEVAERGGQDDAVDALTGSDDTADRAETDGVPIGSKPGAV